MIKEIKETKETKETQQQEAKDFINTFYTLYRKDNIKRRIKLIIASLIYFTLCTISGIYLTPVLSLITVVLLTILSMSPYLMNFINGRNYDKFKEIHNVLQSEVLN